MRNTIRPRLILVLGGARSGKSTFAERLVMGSGRSVAFIATATAGDDEMRARIARHRASRPQEWHTVEEPLKLAEAVRRAAQHADVLLLDCITLWLGNWMGQQHTMQGEGEVVTGSLFDEGAMQEIDVLLAAVHELSPGKTLVVVTNEVGLGVVPAYPLGRLYRDTLGQVNQRLANAADRVFLMIAGIAVDIKRLQEEIAL